MTYRLLITGSRDWDDVATIATQMQRLRHWLFMWGPEDPQDVVVVHGGAKGADAIAGTLATMLGWQVEEHPADWKRQDDGTYDKQAGPRRNLEMVKAGADSCLAFIKDGSKGASHCAAAAKAAGIPTRIIEYTEGAPT